MKKRIYDINIGHYVIINEDDNAPKVNDEQSSQGNDEGVQVTAKKSVSQNQDVMQLNADIDKKKTGKSEELQRLNDMLQQKLKSLEGVEGVGEYLVAETAPEIIQIRKNLLDTAYKYDTDIYNLEIKKLDLIKSLHESEYKIRRYLKLNESNIHGAKVYLNEFVGGESDGLLITGMKEFNRVFYNTKLLYGKDKKGYFAVCLDQEDFDAIYNALYETGYEKDDIIRFIMPQIINRG